jgi:hypothetical protein
MPLTKEDYRKALFAQDACNLSGVVHSLAEVLPRIREEPGCTGTDYVNTHPITIMYVSKLASLSRSERDASFNVAYTACKMRAE